MTGEEPPASGAPGRRRWEDRDTEPIPRARPTEPPFTPAPDPADDYPDIYGGGQSAGGAYYDDPAPLTEEDVAGLRGDPGPSLYSTRRVAPLDDEASRHVARYLFPTEKFRGEWKRHWIQIVKEISIAALATILMGYITGWLTKQDQAQLVTAVIII